MKREDANVGDIVRSRLNPEWRYRIVRCFRTTCWVELITRELSFEKPIVYKGNRYSILEKITE